MKVFDVLPMLAHRIYLWSLRRRGVSIGPDCRFSGRSDFGSEPFLISIGRHVALASGIRFITHDGGTWVFRHEERYRRVIKFGWITICDNCVIGEGVIILPGVSIGPNSVIAAGSVVSRNIPPGVLASGNPAKPVMSLEQYAEWALAATPEYDESEYARDKRACLLKLPLRGWRRVVRTDGRSCA